MQNSRIMILGAGPTGLGAAYRLMELGHTNWLLVEKTSKAGGLAGSITDEKGFTWDLGGHVQFSHYDYFDRVMSELIPPEGWLHHERESWIWIKDRFVPYPFQLNLHRLPPEDIERCLVGIATLSDYTGISKNACPRDFGQWIDRTFGEGIASLFMRPYNFKVWAYPPEMLNITWMGERVAPLNIQRVRQNLENQTDDVLWGPNQTFRFPRRGGTGAIWKQCAEKLPRNQLRFDTEAIGINTKLRQITLADGTIEEYDYLLNTMPLDAFLKMSDLQDLASMASGLMHSSTHIFGIGLKGSPTAQLASKCWMYFPEDNCPFYRVTVFSNYSPGNVPDAEHYWSLMAEVSESPSKPVVSNAEVLLEEVIEGLLNTKLIDNRESIVDTWQTRLEYGYPTPSLHRDPILDAILPELDQRNIGSRGRFGAWRYEVSNQDHSFMQGVEWVNKILLQEPEITVWNPNQVNTAR